MKENSSALALVSDGQEYTYQQLLDEVEAQEEFFRSKNISAGDVVALIGEYSLKSLGAMLALFFRKAVVIPLTREAHEKLNKYVSELGIDYLVDSYSGSLESFPRSSEASWRSVLSKKAGGLIVFTSGSTGVPKAIIHDIDSLCYRYLAKKDPLKSICFLLFDHMGGINTVLFLLFRGGTAVNVSERTIEAVCGAVEKYKVQLLPTTPSFLSQMLMSRAHHTYDLSSLQVISYGTEVMSEAVLKKLNEVMPNRVFKQTYGLSETGVFQIKSRSNDSLWFKFIDDGVETKVEDEVLWIKTKSNLLGKVLFKDEGPELEQTTQEWFCTNDLVKTDGEGYFLILGRKTDIINVGGLKVYPREVEDCIHNLSFVDEVFVQGKKHPLLGQMVVANILLAEGIEKADAEKQIRRHCQEKLEKFKVPSQFIFKWENFVNDRFKKVRTL